MDISFTGENGKFNYRACAVILHDGMVLAMRDERSPYYYLPGGRVKFGETAERAVLRELREGMKFTLAEGGHRHEFEWLRLEQLKNEYFYPLFLKEEILNLPETFTIRTETE